MVCAFLRGVLRRSLTVVVTLLACAAWCAQPVPAPDSPAIQANSNRSPAGSLQNGVLSFRLELRRGDWYPEADTGPSMKVYAFAEEGRVPQVPGPLIRVPEGTEIRVTLRNLLPVAAIVHGLHQHPGDAGDVIQVAAGEVREARFTAGAAGTYQYWATAGGPTNLGRPFQIDSQLAGAFIVDPPGSVADDRVFVIGIWRSQAVPALSNDVPVINGKSWPYTERLTYRAGEPVRWRWINASDVNHPMHMHGSYYRVDSAGDGERDRMFEPALRPMVVTRTLTPGSTMTTLWTPPAGRWIFHCHIVAHMGPEMNVANALRAGSQRIRDHGPNHMAGLVMGITVTGRRSQPAVHGRRRKLRLLVVERPASEALPAGFGFQLEEAGKLVPQNASAPGPPLILERGCPVEITVVNQIHEPTAVHWHGIELESYYDGVVGWGMRGQEATPMIEPGGSFRVRFTPPRAGTFIYHTHLNDEVQLAKGLYGPLIVLEPGERFDPGSDQVFVVSRAGIEPKAWSLLNGKADPPLLHWRRGQRYRVRLINIMSAGFATVSLAGASGPVQWRALAKDAADMPAAQAVLQDARQITWVGETYDFEYEPQVAGTLRLEIENDALHWKIVQPIEIR